MQYVLSNTTGMSSYVFLPVVGCFILLYMLYSGTYEYEHRQQARRPSTCPARVIKSSIINHETDADGRVLSVDC